MPILGACPVSYILHPGGPVHMPWGRALCGINQASTNHVIDSINRYICDVDFDDDDDELDNIWVIRGGEFVTTMDRMSNNEAVHPPNAGIYSNCSVVTTSFNFP
eukprot:15364685-Ditylum_brightwellii.AAC.1